MILLLLTFSLKTSPSRAQIITPKQHVTISSFNDNWGRGFTHITDENRSLGLAIDFHHVLYGKRVSQITATRSGHTNKFDYNPARLDEIDIYVRLPIMSFDTWWHIDGIIGAPIKTVILEAKNFNLTFIFSSGPLHNPNYLLIHSTKYIIGNLAQGATILFYPKAYVPTSALHQHTAGLKAGIDLST